MSMQTMNNPIRLVAETRSLLFPYKVCIEVLKDKNSRVIENPRDLIGETIIFSMSLPDGVFTSQPFVVVGYEYLLFRITSEKEDRLKLTLVSKQEGIPIVVCEDSNSQNDSGLLIVDPKDNPGVDLDAITKKGRLFYWTSNTFGSRSMETPSKVIRYIEVDGKLAIDYQLIPTIRLSGVKGKLGIQQEVQFDAWANKHINPDELEGEVVRVTFNSDESKVDRVARVYKKSTGLGNNIYTLKFVPTLVPCGFIGNHNGVHTLHIDSKDNPGITFEDIQPGKLFKWDYLEVKASNGKAMKVENQNRVCKVVMVSCSSDHWMINYEHTDS